MLAAVHWFQRLWNWSTGLVSASYLHTVAPELFQLALQSIAIDTLVKMRFLLCRVDTIVLRKHQANLRTQWMLGNMTTQWNHICPQQCLHLMPQSLQKPRRANGVTEIRMLRTCLPGESKQVAPLVFTHRPMSKILCLIHPWNFT